MKSYPALRSLREGGNPDREQQVFEDAEVGLDDLTLHLAIARHE
jgi:hypothetical protein